MTLALDGHKHFIDCPDSFCTMINILVLLQIFPDKKTGLCPLVYQTEYILFSSSCIKEKEKKKMLEVFLRIPI